MYSFSNLLIYSYTFKSFALAFYLTKKIVRGSDPNVSHTILGKQVIISEYMPDVETGTKPIAFGDFSYYWIVGRKPVTVRTLLEKFVLYDQIGYLTFEFLDGKLVRNEAIKVIQMADAGK